jgi:hypothetical protein
LRSKQRLKKKKSSREFLDKSLKICKSSMQPISDSLKDQICESWALKKAKRSKPRVFTQSNTRNLPKSQERDAHSGKGSLQANKDT